MSDLSPIAQAALDAALREIDADYEEAFQRCLETMRDNGVAAKAWDPEKHPRHRAGTSEGGRFAPADGAGSVLLRIDLSSDSEVEKAVEEWHQENADFTPEQRLYRAMDEFGHALTDSKGVNRKAKFLASLLMNDAGQIDWRSQRNRLAFVKLFKPSELDLATIQGQPVMEFFGRCIETLAEQKGITSLVTASQEFGIENTFSITQHMRSKARTLENYLLWGGRDIHAIAQRAANDGLDADTMLQRVKPFLQAMSPTIYIQPDFAKSVPLDLLDAARNAGVTGIEPRHALTCLWAGNTLQRDLGKFENLDAIGLHVGKPIMDLLKQADWRDYMEVVRFGVDYGNGLLVHSPTSYLPVEPPKTADDFREMLTIANGIGKNTNLGIWKSVQPFVKPEVFSNLAGNLGVNDLIDASKFFPPSRKLTVNELETASDLETYDWESFGANISALSDEAVLTGIGGRLSLAKIPGKLAYQYVSDRADVGTYEADEQGLNIKGWYINAKDAVLWTLAGKASKSDLDALVWRAHNYAAGASVDVRGQTVPDDVDDVAKEWRDDFSRDRDDDDEASRQKEAIVSSLAYVFDGVSDESDSENLSNDFIHQWARSSNDSDRRSLHIQEAAAQEFGVELTPWQRGRLEDDPVNIRLFTAEHSAEDEIAVMREALRAMYERTQDEFKRYGVTHVRAWRGTKNESAAVNRNIISEWFPTQNNALSSWSTDHRVARAFGENLIEAVIPVEKILSTARTGFGCLDEQELVVLGESRGDVSYVRRSFVPITLPDGFEKPEWAATKAWDPEKHPRHPAGSEQGGQFAPADGAGSESSSLAARAERLYALSIGEVLKSPDSTYDDFRMRLRMAAGREWDASQSPGPWAMANLTDIDNLARIIGDHLDAQAKREGGKVPVIGWVNDRLYNDLREFSMVAPINLAVAKYIGQTPREAIADNWTTIPERLQMAIMTVRLEEPAFKNAEAAAQYARELFPLLYSKSGDSNHAILDHRSDLAVELINHLEKPTLEDVKALVPSESHRLLPLGASATESIAADWRSRHADMTPAERRAAVATDFKQFRMSGLPAAAIAPDLDKLSMKDILGDITPHFASSMSETMKLPEVAKFATEVIKRASKELGGGDIEKVGGFIGVGSRLAYGDYNWLLEESAASATTLDDYTLFRGQDAKRIAQLAKAGDYTLDQAIEKAGVYGKSIDLELVDAAVSAGVRDIRPFHALLGLYEGMTLSSQYDSFDAIPAEVWAEMSQETDDLLRQATWRDHLEAIRWGIGHYRDTSQIAQKSPAIVPASADEFREMLDMADEVFSREKTGRMPEDKRAFWKNVALRPFIGGKTMASFRNDLLSMDILRTADYHADRIFNENTLDFAADADQLKWEQVTPYLDHISDVAAISGFKGHLNPADMPDDVAYRLASYPVYQEDTPIQDWYEMTQEDLHPLMSEGEAKAAVDAVIEKARRYVASGMRDSDGNYLAKVPANSAWRRTFESGRNNDEAASSQKHFIVAGLTDYFAGTPLADQSYLAGNTLIHQWAESSNDNDMRSLNLQIAAAQEFGVEMSDWQRERVERNRDNGDDPLFVALVVPEPVAGDGEIKVLRGALRAMYNETQDHFRRNRVKQVHLYRGVSSLEGHYIEDFNAGDPVQYTDNALSSWTTDPVVASRFGKVILEAVIPVENVLSTARTGFGCLNESEVVVLGKPAGKVSHARVYVPPIPAPRGYKKPSATKAWNEADHPRHRAGTSEGGRFAPADGVGGVSSSGDDLSSEALYKYAKQGDGKEYAAALKRNGLRTAGDVIRLFTQRRYGFAQIFREKWILEPVRDSIGRLPETHPVLTAQLVAYGNARDFKEGGSFREVMSPEGLKQFKKKNAKLVKHYKQLNDNYYFAAWRLDDEGLLTFDDLEFGRVEHFATLKNQILDRIQAGDFVVSALKNSSAKTLAQAEAEMNRIGLSLADIEARGRKQLESWMEEKYSPTLDEWKQFADGVPPAQNSLVARWLARSIVNAGHTTKQALLDKMAEIAPGWSVSTRTRKALGAIDETDMLSLVADEGRGFHDLSDEERALVPQTAYLSLTTGEHVGPPDFETETALIDRFLNPALDGKPVELADELKAHVASSLSASTGIPEDIAGDFVRNWATTSNGADMRALGIQKVAGELFGTELSEWQRADIAGIFNPSKKLYFMEHVEVSEEAARAVAEATGTDPSRTVTREQSEAMTRSLLSSMYNRTQDWFKEQGVTHVQLYRGVMLDKFEGGNVGDAVRVDDNALSSWSVSPIVARNFTVTLSGSRRHRAVFSAVVPVENILSTPYTGFGCAAEVECVVIGAKGPATAMIYLHEAPPPEISIKAWDPEKHPRHAAGTSEGGRFAPADGVGEVSSTLFDLPEPTDDNDPETTPKWVLRNVRKQDKQLAKDVEKAESQGNRAKLRKQKLAEWRQLDVSELGEEAPDIDLPGLIDYWQYNRKKDRVAIMERDLRGSDIFYRKLREYADANGLTTVSEIDEMFRSLGEKSDRRLFGAESPARWKAMRDFQATPLELADAIPWARHDKPMGEHLKKLYGLALKRDGLDTFGKALGALMDGGINLVEIHHEDWMLSPVVDSIDDALKTHPKEMQYLVAYESNRDWNGGDEPHTFMDRMSASKLAAFKEQWADQLARYGEIKSRRSLAIRDFTHNKSLTLDDAQYYMALVRSPYENKFRALANHKLMLQTILENHPASDIFEAEAAINSLDISFSDMDGNYSLGEFVSKRYKPTVEQWKQYMEGRSPFRDGLLTRMVGRSIIDAGHTSKQAFLAALDSISPGSSVPLTLMNEFGAIDPGDAVFVMSDTWRSFHDLNDAEIAAAPQTAYLSLTTGEFVGPPERKSESALIRDMDEPYLDGIRTSAPGLKAHVANTLAASTGLPADLTSDFVHNWAITSNGSDMRALGIQQTASEIFGNELSEWQRAEIKAIRKAADKKLFKEGERLSEDDMEAIAKATGTTPSRAVTAEQSTKMTRRILTTMYDNTQAWFKERGITHVQLYRGVKLEKFSGGNIADAVRVDDNALASWTLSPYQAGSFSGYERFRDLHSVTFSAVVPVENILSTPYTGFGCYEEREFVVIGAKGPATAMIYGYTSPEAKAMKAWVEEEHPRHPAGTEDGGQFAPKDGYSGGGGAAAGEFSPTSKPVAEWTEQELWSVPDLSTDDFREWVQSRYAQMGKGLVSGMPIAAVVENRDALMAYAARVMTPRIAQAKDYFGALDMLPGVYLLNEYAFMKPIADKFGVSFDELVNESAFPSLMLAGGILHDKSYADYDLGAMRALEYRRGSFDAGVISALIEKSDSISPETLEYIVGTQSMAAVSDRSVMKVAGWWIDAQGGMSGRQIIDLSRQNIDQWNPGSEILYSAVMRHLSADVKIGDFSAISQSTLENRPGVVALLDDVIMRDVRAGRIRNSWEYSESLPQGVYARFEYLAERAETLDEYLSLSTPHTSKARLPGVANIDRILEMARAEGISNSNHLYEVLADHGTLPSYSFLKAAEAQGFEYGAPQIMATIVSGEPAPQAEWEFWQRSTSARDVAGFLRKYGGAFSNSITAHDAFRNYTAPIIDNFRSDNPDDFVEVVHDIIAARGVAPDVLSGRTEMFENFATTSPTLHQALYMAEATKAGNLHSLAKLVYTADLNGITWDDIAPYAARKTITDDISWASLAKRVGIHDLPDGVAHDMVLSRIDDEVIPDTLYEFDPNIPVGTFVGSEQIVEKARRFHYQGVDTVTGNTELTMPDETYGQWVAGTRSGDPDKEAPIIKNMIVGDLQFDTDLDYDEANDFIHQWANSSNGSDTRSLHIQMAAADEFETELSVWQEDSLEGATQELLWASSGERWDAYTSQAEISRMRSALRVMYDLTQEHFAEAGVSRVRAYRGVRLEGADNPLNSARPGDAVSYSDNALSSWSLSPSVAKRFGYVVMEASIPVSQILSTCRTGFGCLEEQELVVIGAKGEGHAKIYQSMSGRYVDGADRRDELPKPARKSATKAWDPAKHPRHAAGTEDGGQFAPADGATGGGKVNAVTPARRKDIAIRGIEAIEQFTADNTLTFGDLGQFLAGKNLSPYNSFYQRGWEYMFTAVENFPSDSLVELDAAMRAAGLPFERLPHLGDDPIVMDFFADRFKPTLDDWRAVMLEHDPVDNAGFMSDWLAKTIVDAGHGTKEAFMATLADVAPGTEIPISIRARYNAIDDGDAVMLMGANAIHPSDLSESALSRLPDTVFRDMVSGEHIGPPDKASEKALRQKFADDYADERELKAHVAQQLAASTGISEKMASDFVHNWAITSNGKDMRALGIQEAAAELFGVDLSDWQRLSIDEAYAYDRADHFYEGESLKPAEASAVAQATGTGFSEFMTREQSKALSRRLLDTMYRKTQDWFKDQGISHVYLFRGVKMDKSPGGNTGDAIRFDDNALASWSIDPKEANKFAGGELGGAHFHGVTLSAMVPVENILSTPYTGFGCFGEKEFVVIGAKGPATALVYRYYPAK